MPRPLLAAALVLSLVATPVLADSLDPASRDTTCAPCRDFDQYANGGWRATFVMPASYSRYGAFTEVSDRNQRTLVDIVTRAASSKAKAGTDEARLGDYWSSCMDSAAAEKAGLRPVAPLLDAVRDLRDKKDLARTVAWFHAHGVGTLFGFFGNQDAKDSKRVIAHAGQGGLGLPDRD